MSERPRASRYNPITDEKKQFSLRDFETELKSSVEDFANDFDDPGSSEFMKGNHTFDEWMSAFKRWMSF